jgi:sec-independent protein translocase protein TatA
MGLDNPLHIAFLLIILLLVFGAKRLPEMGRSLGEGLRGFKDTMSGEAHAHHAVPTGHTETTRPAATVVQPQPQVGAAPAQTVVTPVVHAPATEDPQVLAAARTLSAQHGVVETERSIERELLRS